MNEIIYLGLGVLNLGMSARMVKDKNYGTAVFSFGCFLLMMVCVIKNG